MEPQIRPVMVGSKTNQNQKDKQIIIQILSQKQEIVDEAVYSDENIEQALFDFERKGGYLKRLGIRSDGQDLFYQEKKGAGKMKGSKKMLVIIVIALTGIVMAVGVAG